MKAERVSGGLYLWAEAGIEGFAVLVSAGSVSEPDSHILDSSESKQTKECGSKTAVNTETLKTKNTVLSGLLTLKINIITVCLEFKKVTALMVQSQKLYLYDRKYEIK